MREELKGGREPQHARCAWIAAVAAFAMAGLVPAWATAQVPGAPPGDTAIDDSDEAAEAEAFSTTEVTDEMLSEQQLDEAQRRIEQAERDLEEAKRQMQLAGRKLAPEPAPVPGTGPGLVSADGQAKKLQVSLNEDGTLYFRFAAWLQVWARAIQLNPGTTVANPDPVTNPTENQEDWYGDVALRRARFLMFGQIFPRVFLLMHVGINNQTFRRGEFKQQVFFHDAWAEFQVTKTNKLYIGGGLLYWNGISRITNASTITLMTLDAPITNWPTIEATDQFARQLGLYAKGKLGLFDYRVAVTRPTQPAGTGPTTGTAVFNPAANSWAFKGYFMFQFLDEESNVLPYTVGTYIGAKKVFNLGLGGHIQPRGVAYLREDLSVKEIPMWFAAADLFFDRPTGTKGNAITWYAVYYRQQMGPDLLRQIGIMNPGDVGSGTSANGRGNQYPTIGTGNTGYVNFGWLIPASVGALGMKFQPYAHTQISDFEARNDPMIWVGAGINMFIHRHNAKVTLEYRNRPIYNAEGKVENRKGNSLILQMHLFI